MDFPGRDEIRIALLYAYGDGKVHWSEAVEPLVARHLNLDETQRAAPNGDGSRTRLGNEIDWVKGAFDEEYGFFERVRDKFYKLSESGMAALAAHERDPTAPLKPGTFAGLKPGGALGESDSPLADQASASGFGDETESEDLATQLLTKRPFDPARVPTFGQLGLAGGLDLETIIAAREKANQRHHQVLVALDAWLRKRCWRDIYEQPGGIDLQASTPDLRKRVIFEAKTVSPGNELTQTRKALAQLLEYRLLPGGQREDLLCLVVDRTLSDRRAQLLNKLQVAVIVAVPGTAAVRSGNALGQRLTS